jgi:hypothetical protein
MEMSAPFRQAGSTHIPKMKLVVARSDVMKLSPNGVNRLLVSAQ